jgi:hypothetical protein
MSRRQRNGVVFFSTTYNDLPGYARAIAAASSPVAQCRVNPNMEAALVNGHQEFEG